MRDKSLFGVAGIWENWCDPKTGEWLRTLALITTDANALVSTIHDRMPVILHEGEYAAWLGQEPSAPIALKAMLRPFPPEQMTMWPVDAPQSPAKRRRGTARTSRFRPASDLVRDLTPATRPGDERTAVIMHHEARVR